MSYAEARKELGVLRSQRNRLTQAIKILTALAKSRGMAVALRRLKH